MSGITFTGEGADFRLEEINKGLQHWVGHNPSKKKWENACNNFNDMNNIRKNTYSQLGVNDPKNTGHHKHTSVSQQIIAFRSLLRKQEYFLHPRETRLHRSLSGELLDKNLVNFGELSKDKWSRFATLGMAHYCDTRTRGTAVPFNEPPVFVTSEERREAMLVANKTIKEILLMCEQKLTYVTDDDIKDSFNSELLRLKKRVPK